MTDTDNTTDATVDEAVPEKPKGTFTPGRFRDPELAREANRRSIASRRAKKAASAELAQWNAMAVKQRAAVTISKAASAERLNGVLEALLDKAEKGDTRAATEVRAWLALGASLTEEDEAKEGELTASQRAAIRANLLRNLEAGASGADAAMSEFVVEEDGDAAH